MYQEQYTQQIENRATRNLEAIIRTGPQSAGNTLQLLQQDSPKDYIVDSSKLDFNARGNTVQAQVVGDNGISQFSVHSHALGQMADRVGIPRKYVSRLLEQDKSGWGANLLATNLQEHYNHKDKNRYLVRSASGEIRGFMSDRYLRLDSGMLVESFLKACNQVGAVPAQGYYLTTKYYLKMVIPKVLNPYPGEYMVIGMYFRDSMFGDGPAAVGISMDRLVCINGMIGSDELKKIHLGSRVSSDIAISERTYKLDSAALASTIYDVASNVLSPAAIDTKMEAIRTAHEEDIDLKDAMKALKSRQRLTKGEAEGVTDVFNTGGIEELPSGNSMWRLANAISTFSKQEDVEPSRKMELQSLAGDLVGMNNAA